MSKVLLGRYPNAWVIACNDLVQFFCDFFSCIGIQVIEYPITYDLPIRTNCAQFSLRFTRAKI